MKVLRLLLVLLRGLYKMGICLIQKSGGAPDTRGVTALESDVLKGKTFLKSDGNAGTGTMESRGAPDILLPINGDILIPEGNYTGGKVKQNIPTFSGTTVYSGKNPVTVETAGKYASGNVYVAQIKNLTPAVIKYGEYVGGVGPGTWQGYVNDDPDVPFFYGTFGPGFDMASLQLYRDNPKGNAWKGKDDINISAAAGSPVETVAIVIAKPINLSLYRSITWLADYDGSSTSYFMYFIARNRVESWIRRSASQSDFNPDLGEVLKYSPAIISSGTENTVDVSGLSGNAYLYLSIRSAPTRDYSASIYYIKCNR